MAMWFGTNERSGQISVLGCWLAILVAVAAALFGGRAMPVTASSEVTRTASNTRSVASSPNPGTDPGIAHAATDVGRNLIVNGRAEAGPASTDGSRVTSIPGWTTTNSFTVITYDNPNGFPTASDPGPLGRGTSSNMNFFGGGNGHAVSTATQTIRLSSSDDTAIDAGKVSYTLSGYIGGYAEQTDHAVVTAKFQSGSGSSLGKVQIGPVTPTDRGDQTGLFPRSTGATVPANTRKVVVTITMTRYEGVSNDGYADNLSLVLSTKNVNG